MIIAAVIVIWLALGYAGSLMVLWYGFAGDGLPVRRSDFLGLAVGMSVFGPLNLLIGCIYAVGNATAKSRADDEDPIVWEGRK